MTSLTIISDEEPAATPPSLDYDAFPHVFERIVELAPIAALFPLRAVCRRLRLQIDTSRLALHVVVTDTRAHTQYGQISLHVCPHDRNAKLMAQPRPELFRYTRTLDVDLTCSRCEKRCFGGPETPQLDIIETIAHEAGLQALDLDLIRVLTPRYNGVPDFVAEEASQAKCTLYFEKLAADNEHYTSLLLTPIFGSEEVIINVCSEGNYTPTTFVKAIGQAGKQTTVLFTAQSTPDGIPKFDGPMGLATNLAIALAEQVADGHPDVHVTIVGVEQWPQGWFFKPTSQRERELAPEEYRSTVVREFFEDFYVQALQRKLGDPRRTLIEMQEEASAKLSFVTMKDYEERWSSLHPDGLSIIRRWRL